MVCDRFSRSSVVFGEGVSGGGGGGGGGGGAKRGKRLRFGGISNMMLKKAPIINLTGKYTSPLRPGCTGVSPTMQSSIHFVVFIKEKLNAYTNLFYKKVIMNLRLS